MPLGSQPPVTANVYGGVPPDAEIEAPAYAAPTVPPGAVPGDSVIVGGTAVTVSVADALVPPPGAGLVTVTRSEPGAATRDVGTVVVTDVELAK
jgi:hypothetical protein